ncbi:MAG: carboxyl transferase domain-containing protein, partial [Pseudomonadota bacterium]|nr:carboxyl transferase domain-containing protein [Pseudomonadota bacterium]
MAWDEEIREVHRKRDLAKLLGGEEGVARQHAKGRLTIRERIDGLLDEGSFRELGMGAGSAYRDEDGNVTEFLPANFVLGFGKVEGRDCIIGGEDFTLKGGSPNAAGLRKSVYAEDLALKYKMPLIRLHEGGGGSVTGAGGGKGAPAAVGSPAFEAPRFRSVAKTMNLVPVATAALGPVAGLPASRLVSSHFCVMTQETAQVLVAGPAVVARALGENLTKEQLGSAAVHTRNGVADNVAKDETDAFTQIRQFLSYMPR